jgi:hypothetical protein
MFSDPQVVTVNAVAKSMPRTESNGLQSIYRLADETFKLTISHQKPKGRVRSMARIDQKAIVTDPLSSTSDSNYETLSIYLVVDRPDYGFTSTQVDQLRAGLSAWLDSTATGKLYGLES